MAEPTLAVRSLVDEEVELLGLGGSQRIAPGSQVRLGRTWLRGDDFARALADGRLTLVAEESPTDDQKRLARDVVGSVLTRVGAAFAGLERRLQGSLRELERRREEYNRALEQARALVEEAGRSSHGARALLDGARRFLTAAPEEAELETLRTEERDLERALTAVDGVEAEFDAAARREMMLDWEKCREVRRGAEVQLERARGSLEERYGALLRMLEAAEAGLAAARDVELGRRIEGRE